MLGFRKREEAVVVITSDEPTTEDDATTTTASNCAWCGDPPNEYGSHGICAAHAESLLIDLKWDRLQAVPSYVERFKQEGDR